MISRLPNLKYLDDRPVFADDRRNAEAFARGGLDEERKEREIIAQEKRDRDDRNRKHFNDMIKKAREERRAAEEAKKAAERSASPAESNTAAVTDSTEKESAETTEKVAAQAVAAKEDDAEADLPPELEHVDAE